MESGLTDEDKKTLSQDMTVSPREWVGYLKSLKDNEFKPLYRDGEPCDHPGCLNHVTHPCEGCGRVAGETRV